MFRRGCLQPLTPASVCSPSTGMFRVWPLTMLWGTGLFPVHGDVSSESPAILGPFPFVPRPRGCFVPPRHRGEARQSLFPVHGDVSCPIPCCRAPRAFVPRPRGCFGGSRELLRGLGGLFPVHGDVSQAQRALRQAQQVCSPSTGMFRPFVYSLFVFSPLAQCGT